MSEQEEVRLLRTTINALMSTLNGVQRSCEEHKITLPQKGFGLMAARGELAGLQQAVEARLASLPNTTPTPTASQTNTEREQAQNEQADTRTDSEEAVTVAGAAASVASGPVLSDGPGRITAATARRGWSLRGIFGHG